MPTATEFPPSIMSSKITGYQSVKEILTALESIFSSLVKELLNDELLNFSCPRNTAVVVYPCPYGGAILSETGLPGDADEYLNALSDIALTFNKNHSARIIGFVKVCRIDMKILLSTDIILAKTVATKLEKIKTDCSRMLKLIDQEILAIKSTEEPVVVPKREIAINSIRQEFGDLLDNINKNEVLQQIVSRDFENAVILMQKDWEKLLGVTGRTIRGFSAWKLLSERKKQMLPSRTQRSRPARKKSTTTKPLATTTKPLATTTEPLKAATEQLEATTEPLEATTEPLEAATEPLEAGTESLATTTEPRATTTAWLEAATEPLATTTEPRAATIVWLEATTEQLEAITEPLEAAANR